MRYFWNLRSRKTPDSVDQPLRGEVASGTLRVVLGRYLDEKPLLVDGDRFECWTEAQVEVVEKVRALDWGKIKETVLKEEAELNDEGDSLIRSLFWCSYLGTPSGKVYTPFANGNLTPCPYCSTWRDDLDGNAKILMAIVDAERERLLRIKEDLYAKIPPTDAPERDQFFKTSEWLAYIERLNAAAMKFPDRCPACDGQGSHEASLDSVWHSEMDRVAEREGLFIDCNGSGYFICASEPVTQDDEDAPASGNEE